MPRFKLLSPDRIADIILENHENYSRWGDKDRLIKNDDLVSMALELRELRIRHGRLDVEWLSSDLGIGDDVWNIRK